MAMTAEQYRDQLMALMPFGDAWPREPDSVMADLLHAIADELGRLDARINNLIAEADPRTCNEMIDDWESAYGLPSPCGSLAITLGERRAMLLFQIATYSALTPQFYVTVAALLGYTITVEQPWTVAIDEFTWRINAPSTTVRYFRSGSSRSGDALTIWGDDLFECVMQRLKPAHTTLLIAYA